MPRIRPYEQQISAEQGIPAQQAQGSDFGGPGLQHLGQSIVSAGQDFGYAQRVMQANYSRKAVTDVHTFFSNTRAEFTKRAKEIELQADPADAESAWKTFAFGDGGEDAPSEGSLKQYLDAYGEKIEDPDAKAVFQQQAAHLTEQFSNHFVGVQARLEGVYAQQQAIKLVDGAQATVQTDPSQYESVLAQTMAAIDDPRSIYGRLPADKREPIKRQVTEQIASSTVRGMIGDSPQHALRSIQSGEWDGKISGEQKIVLMRAAETAISAQETEQRRALADADKQRIAAARASETKLFLKMAAHEDDPTQPALKATDPELATLAESDPVKAMSILSTIHTRAREQDKPIKTNPVVERSLFNRIHATPDQPKLWAHRISDETPLNQEYTKGNISFDTLKELRKELGDARSPGGQLFSREKAAFFKGIEQQITRPGPMGVYADPANGELFLRFKQDFNATVEQYKKDGKDPWALMKSESQDYFARPSNLKKYQSTGFRSLQQPSQDLTPDQQKQLEGILFSK